MIARVRIAPIEHWCEEVRRCCEEDPVKAGNTSEVGMEIEILTETMDIASDCKGREWIMTDASVDALVMRTGAKNYDRPCWICEHMLEMD